MHSPQARRGADRRGGDGLTASSALQGVAIVQGATPCISGEQFAAGAPSILTPVATASSTSVPAAWRCASRALARRRRQRCTPRAS